MKFFFKFDIMKRPGKNLYTQKANYNKAFHLTIKNQFR